MDLKKSLATKILIPMIFISLLVGFLIYGTLFFSFPDSSDDFIEVNIKTNVDLRKYKTSGSGKINDPYILNQFTFHENKSIGLRITGVSKYIEIRDVHFKAFGFGLYLYKIEYPGLVTVRNCSFLNCDMDVYETDQIRIINNTFVNNEVGIHFTYSRNNYIADNHFDSGGLCVGLVESQIEKIETFTLSDNYINDKEILFLKNENHLSLKGNFSQIFLFNCLNVTVENAFAYTASHSVLVSDSENCSLSKITAYTLAHAVLILNSPNTQILSCYFENVVNKSNKIYFHDDYGISVLYSTNFSLSNSSINNYSHTGVQIQYSTNASFEYNIFVSSGFSGLTIRSSDHCNIVYNQFMENNFVGVWLVNSEEIYVYHNNFLNNSWVNNGSEGWNSNGQNYWYSSILEEGNFWSSLGNETIYIIDETEGIYDLYPFTTPINIFG
ncbi:MAG: right-handed parallel beta-helix repeat-containing protein [Candidatus Heimdallarchaeota archaeon]|nr:right-handed parallel beta-helix repeat-containing protein [Candidatus Heimdallarchaeota archaeon]MCK5143065.1 right-handed parallel beta-helix repeat-containing protein [Candidatus Heimdallarchaeota archaeon]